MNCVRPCLGQLFVVAVVDFGQSATRGPGSGLAILGRYKLFATLMPAEANSFLYLFKRYLWMMKPTTMQSNIGLIGGLVALLGVGFVMERLYFHSAHINFAALGGWTWLCLVLLSAVYGAANVILALAWRKLLLHFGAVASKAWTVWAYGLAQIAKYVPGNIVHLAGRLALGARAGWPQRTLAMSSIWELALMAIAGLMFGCLVLPLFVVAITPALALGVFALTVTGAVVSVSFVFTRHVAAALFFQVLFLVVSALIFVGIVCITGQISHSPGDIVVVAGAFVVAWLVGFVTPGAPAGIGIRELVVLMLLGQTLPPADLVIAVGLSRFVTTLGDFLFFISVSFCGRGEFADDTPH